MIRLLVSVGRHDGGAVAARDVVSETIGDETIILDMRTGTFFATRGGGTTLWQALEAGHSADEIVVRLAEGWGEGPELSSVRDLLHELDERDLVAEPTGAGGDPLTALAATPSLMSLEIHEDLSDLLLLDPVHDVAAQGWPTPAPE